MNSKAYAVMDFAIDGVRLAVTHTDPSGRPHERLSWTWPDRIRISEADTMVEPPEDAWLRLSNEDARAVYEALAEHFGHAGHDMRALRQDYDAERKRVDTFINHLTKPA
jgi:hypothetical protein